MMGPTGVAAAVLLLCVALSMVAVGSAAADSPYKSNFISREALERADVEPESSRRLIGTVDPGFCPVRFNQIHSFGAIASSCRGVPVSAEQCCGAFKEFACPYRDLMNDVENGCAREMFHQIITTCRLQPGLFSGMCHEGSEGLACGSI